MGMDPQHLRTFVAVVGHRSFSAAARTLGYTQSAVSQHVAALEADLQTRLVTRRPVASTSTPPASNGGKPVTPPATTTAPVITQVPAAERSVGGWSWPANGVLIGKFASNGSLNKGIDIAGDLGQPVFAAYDGAVVYAGSGLRGYGELIIIKHSEQWLSAYGHNRKRLVNEGQNVKAGEQIAEMGRTGAAREMLHFEIRYNGKPVDPLLYLPKK